MATRHARTTTPDPRRALAADALRRELAAAVGELRTEPGFRAWLHACASLSRYSPTNVLLIVAQARRRGLDPAHAAPLRTWARLGYRVRAGERGLLIRRPITVTTDVRPLDERDGGDDDDAPRRTVGFRAGHVFTRDQVDPIPGRHPAPLGLPDPPIHGKRFTRELATLEASLAADGWTVTRAPLPRGVGGTCDATRMRVTIAAGLEPDAQLRVLVHEAAHAEGGTARTHGRARAECIVEAATYIVCARLGLDVRATSVPYIAGWEGTEPGALDRDAAEINRVTLAVDRRVRELDRRDED
jgi:N-terminal domain of anti-restriction factor ArdC